MLSCHWREIGRLACEDVCEFVVDLCGFSSVLPRSNNLPAIVFG